MEFLCYVYYPLAIGTDIIRHSLRKALMFKAFRLAILYDKI